MKEKTFRNLVSKMGLLSIIGLAISPFFMGINKGIALMISSLIIFFVCIILTIGFKEHKEVKE